MSPTLARTVSACRRREPRPDASPRPTPSRLPTQSGDPRPRPRPCIHPTAQPCPAGPAQLCKSRCPRGQEWPPRKHSTHRQSTSMSAPGLPGCIFLFTLIPRFSEVSWRVCIHGDYCETCKLSAILFRVLLWPTCAFPSCVSSLLSELDKGFSCLLL